MAWLFRSRRAAGRRDAPEPAPMFDESGVSEKICPNEKDIPAPANPGERDAGHSR